MLGKDVESESYKATRGEIQSVAIDTKRCLAVITLKWLARFDMWADDEGVPQGAWVGVVAPGSAVLPVLSLPFSQWTIDELDDGEMIRLVDSTFARHIIFLKESWKLNPSEVKGFA